MIVMKDVLIMKVTTTTNSVHYYRLQECFFYKTIEEKKQGLENLVKEFLLELRLDSSNYGSWTKTNKRKDHKIFKISNSACHDNDT